jgi:hypothetical protein
MLLPDPARLAAFERALARSQRPDHRLNLALYEALYHHAVALGGWTGADPLAGLDADLRYARALNVRTAPR